MKLVAGLGNPGASYRNHRHNVGYRAVEQFASVFAAGRWKERFDGQLSECLIGQEKILLLKPLTFMNASGRSVRRVVDFYNLAAADVLVICDDFQLPIGAVRIRTKGSAGGQKGLADILTCMGTDAVHRLRIGIGDPGGSDPADYVLCDVPPGEAPAIHAALDTSVSAVECWCRDGVDAAMNRFNSKQSLKE